MERLNIDILGETKRFDKSLNMYEVGVVINTKSAKALLTFVPKPNPCIPLSNEAKPNIDQLYAPTTDRSDQDIDKFYGEAKSLLNILKKQDINLVM